MLSFLCSFPPFATADEAERFLAYRREENIMQPMSLSTRDNLGSANAVSMGVSLFTRDKLGANKVLLLRT